MFCAGDAAAEVLAADQAALVIGGVAVGVLRRISEHGDMAIAFIIAQHAVVGDVRPDEIATCGKPCRSFSPTAACPQALHTRMADQALLKAWVEDFVCRAFGLAIEGSAFFDCHACGPVASKLSLPVLFAGGNSFVMTKIPLLGFGTYPLRGQACVDAVTMALDMGVRHIDTAQMYGNERDVGRAIASHSAKRTDLYVVTKVDPGNIRRFAQSVRKSIDDLGGPCDLLLIHWPPPDDEIDVALDHLMQAKADGLTAAIGVSNFSSRMMRNAQARLGGQVVCNQVEFHPLIDQQKLVVLARELGMMLTAYSPIARGGALKPDVIVQIAAKHGRLPSEIVLRWIIQQGVAAIPMTTKQENLASNLRALSFELPQEDIDAITVLGSWQGRTIDPSWMRGRWDG
jgi:2,5-diketo-D-gluconate reductase B